MPVRAIQPSLPQTSPGNVFRLLEEVLDPRGLEQYSVSTLERLIGQPKQGRALLRFLGVVERTGQLSARVRGLRGKPARVFARFLKDQVEDRYGRLGQNLLRRLWDPRRGSDPLRGDVAAWIERQARKRDGGRIESAAVAQMAACLLALRDAVIHDCEPDWLAAQHGPLGAAPAPETDPSRDATARHESDGTSLAGGDRAPTPTGESETGAVANAEAGAMPPHDWHRHWDDPADRPAAAAADRSDLSERLLDVLGVAPLLHDRTRHLVLEAERVHVNGTVFEGVRLRID